MTIDNMSKKVKNYINIEKSLMLFRDGYSFDTEEYNFYQFRIRHEEHKGIFYDWYHTTGTLVKNKYGQNQKMTVIKDPEDVCLFIEKNLINEKD